MEFRDWISHHQAGNESPILGEKLCTYSPWHKATQLLKLLSVVFQKKVHGEDALAGGMIQVFLMYERIIKKMELDACY